MPSFDVVSEVDMQEVKNAIDQVVREIGTRYDFKGSKTEVELKEKDSLVQLLVDDQMKLDSVHDILKQKLSKRGVSLKSLEFKDPEKAGGDMLRQTVLIKQGLDQDRSKKINKLIKDSKIKVNTQIQGEQLRVMGKKRDDLQQVIAYLKSNVDDIDLQFVNFRD